LQNALQGRSIESIRVAFSHLQDAPPIHHQLLTLRGQQRTVRVGKEKDQLLTWCDAERAEE
jgi:hypothetical protein